MVISQIEPLLELPNNSLFTMNMVPYFVLQHKLYKYLESTTVKLQAKTTHSTILANNANRNPTLQHIPTQSQKYHSVFSE